MGKLRHIAVATADPQSLAGFYERAFGFERVTEFPADAQGAGGVMLSDGTINLTIYDFGDDPTGHGKGFSGLHHMGVIVDDVEATSEALVELGATSVDVGAPPANGSDWREIKFRDPDGTIFDIAGGPWRGSHS